MKNIYLFILLFVAGATAFSQTTIFTYGTTWKYLDDGSNQGTAWRATGFNDAGWASGGGQLGYGDGDETTILNACGTVTQYPTCTNKYIGYYFRKTVNISNVNLFQNFQFNMYRDDGVVIYVNGTEVYRNNMPTGTINYNTTASSAASDDGNSVISTTLSVAASQFVSGSNTIAVEVHQSSGTSSDVTWDMELIGLPLSAVGAVITRGPYLQKGTSASVILRWQTDNATDSEVTYGTDSTNLSQSVIVPASTTDHSVQLSGLQPYTKYYYSVGSTTGILQSGGQNYFLTTPLAGTGDKYRFWVNGDCGNNSTNQRNVRDKYAQYVGNGITNGFLLAGDNAYNGGYDNEFQTNFFDIYDGGVLSHTYLYPAPGNHDYDNNATNQNTHAVPYYTIFDCPSNGEAGGVPSGTEAFYSFDYDNIHFLSLDSYGKENNTTRIYDTTGAQVTWIKQDLAANTKQWVIAYWHHPPYTMGSHTSDGESELVNIRQKFIRILERMGVDLIICGHSHDYERSKLMKGHYGLENTFNATTHNVSQSTGKYDGTANSCAYMKDSMNPIGTVYVVAGSAGQLGGTQSSFPHNAMYYSNATQGGSLVLEIEKNRLDAKWVCYDGVIRDQFTMFKDAGKVYTMTINYGDSISATASWIGQYSWSPSGGSAQSTILHPAASGDYVVSDPYQCVADTFHINVVMPAVTITSVPNPGVCEGGANVSIPFTQTGMYDAGNVYELQLSDASGSFASPVVIGTLTATTGGTINGTIPAGTPAGANYRMRIVTSAPATTSAPSAAFAIFALPAVTISNLNATYAANDPDATPTLTPVGGTLSGTGVVGSMFSPSVAGVGGPYTIVYSYTDANGCSNADSADVTVLAPTSLTEFSKGGGFIVYPNPASNRFTINLELEEETAVAIDMYDANGKKIQIAAEKNMPQGRHLLEVDREHLNLANGIYFVKVKAGSEEKSIRVILK